jgi:hypothetical protein
MLSPRISIDHLKATLLTNNYTVMLDIGYSDLLYRQVGEGSMVLHIEVASSIFRRQIKETWLFWYYYE